MNISEMLNLDVVHKAFGKGTITEVVDNYVIIQFASKKSKFFYPDAFEEFLVAQDELVQSAILQVIAANRKASEEKRLAAELARKKENERCDIVKKTVPSTKKRKSVEDGFGADYNVKHLAKQPILTYQQVEKQFGIRITGFGRGINKTSSTLVLVSSIDKKKTGFVYHDHWTSDGDYIYSGEGKNGDQKLIKGNKAIVEAQHDGKCIHLFVKFSPQEYYYQGVFYLVNYYYEEEKDEAGNMRKEYKFRLRKQSIEE